jgi:hypothetical protein
MLQSISIHEDLMAVELKLLVNFLSMFRLHILHNA